jgi:hypothetical protein
MLTLKLPVSTGMAQSAHVSPSTKIYYGGRSDTDMKALAVTPRISPLTSEVMTMMPVAKLLVASIASRHWP